MEVVLRPLLSLLTPPELKLKRPGWLQQRRINHLRARRLEPDTHHGGAGLYLGTVRHGSVLIVQNLAHLRHQSMRITANRNGVVPVAAYMVPDAGPLMAK